MILTGTNTSPNRNGDVTKAAAFPAAGRLRLLVVHNPVAGWRRRRLLDRVVDALRAGGALVEVRRTATRGDAERITRAALGDGFDRLVVAGGDGTINEAANALAGSTLPLAIVPLGTANVLAAEIGLGGDAQAVARAILDGPAARIALGTVNGRRFAMMAGVGFDAAVVAGVSTRLKRHLGKGAYVLAMLRLLCRFRPQAYQVTADGRRYAAGSVVLAKGRHYAGRFVCAPAARLDRPLLELCLFRAADRLSILRYAAALALGRIDRLSDVTIVSAREAVIEGAAGEPVQGDGDILGQLPARIAVAPESLLLVVPAGSPLALGTRGALCSAPGAGKNPAPLDGDGDPSCLPSS